MSISLEFRALDDAQCEQAVFIESNEGAADSWNIRAGFRRETAKEKQTWAQAADVILEQLKKPFVRIVCFSEDTIFNVMPNGVFFTISAYDAFSGKHHAATINRDQLIAVVMLCYGGDEVHRAEDYYAIAESVMADFPNECRMIP